MMDDFKMPETIYAWKEDNTINGVWIAKNLSELEVVSYTRTDLCVPRADVDKLLSILRNTYRFIDRLIMTGAWEPSEGDALLDKADKAITEYEQKHGEKK